MNNASSSTQWGLYHAGQNGTGGLSNGSLGFYNFALSSHILQLRSDGQIAINTATDSTSTTSGCFTVAGGAGIAKKLYVGTDVFIGGTSLTTSLGSKQPLHANLTSLSGATPTLPSLTTTGDITINGTYLKIPNTGFSQINLGNMYINCTPVHERGDLHFFDTPTNHRFIGWYSNSLTLSLGPMGGAGLIHSQSQVDFGFNSVTQNVIQANLVGNTLKVKNRHASGYSTIQFENNNATVSGYIGVGNTSTAAPYQNMMYIKADSGLYLDGQGQTGIPSGFSKTFTTTRTTQTYMGSIALYANSDNYGIDVSLRVDGNVVKTMYLFWRYAGQILRFPLSFITTGLSIGAHTFTLTWTGSNLGFDVSY
ncbi:hypothetical protein DFS34DRAFT_353601 [Phlyctochytrium arcticum]|nr:hypothetical protein DFS34DRAFT_353601 [Phlyctochytrium arcticum]